MRPRGARSKATVKTRLRHGRSSLAALLGAATILATPRRRRRARRLRDLRQEPDQEPRCRHRCRDHGGRRVRSGARLDERGGPVRRRLLHVPERLVSEPVEGSPRTGARTTSSAEPPVRRSRRRRRSASRRSSCPRRRRQEGDAQRLARELRTKNTAQVRAQFEDASGKVLSTVRIGPDTTISGTDMAARSRNGKVPAGAKQVTIVVTFGGGGAAYKLAGADSLSLVLS